MRILLALLALLVTPAAAGAATLEQRITRIANASPVGSAASIAVRDADGRLVVAIRAEEPRIPASNEKLITAATALTVLDPDGRLQTAIVAAGGIENGVVRGDIWLVGGGDAAFSTPAFARAAYGGGVATTRTLARALKRSGVRRITGGVRTDATRFDRRVAGPGWKASFTPTECPPLSALTVNRAPANPPLRAARALRGALRAEGIAVGPARAGRAAPAGATTLARVRSPRIRWFVRQAGTYSDNFVAEMLLKAVAADNGRLGTTARGAARARVVLRGLGVDLDNFRILDGSGLARDNRATASGLAELLVAVRDEPEIAEPFLDSLARPGRSGTLQDRMTTGPARDAVYAKTGTLNDVSTLSGYAGSYSFSILIERPGLDRTAALALQDRIAQVLSRERTYSARAE